MKPRILVSGPSNTSVDNIVLRIMERGFVDDDGQRYNPSLIRFGRGAADGTRDVWLEALVKLLLNEPEKEIKARMQHLQICLLYTSPSPRDGLLSRMPSSA